MAPSCPRCPRLRASTTFSSPAGSPNGTAPADGSSIPESCSTARARWRFTTTSNFSPRMIKTGFPSASADARVVDTDLGRIGLMICFDGRIPEIARSLALQGAEIIVDMANFFAMDQADMWGPARSYENGVWLVAATKAGYERSIYYPGGSMIVDPNGRVAAKMPYDRHGVIVADVSPEFAREKPIYSANDKFADRRPSTYGMLVEDYRDLPVAKTAH